MVGWEGEEKTQREKTQRRGEGDGKREEERPQGRKRKGGDEQKETGLTEMELSAQ